ncbi:MAG: DUF3488 domain-containing transglutaminase family protein [Colwellia sp.]|nr:DUF3488 domain-containing transglutaminase family protein [Colwellia sp.]
MIFFNKKKDSKIVERKAKIRFNFSYKNAWFLWLCQCLNIAVISLELSTWMLAIILLSLAWQALLLHKSNVHTKTSFFTKTLAKDELAQGCKQAQLLKVSPLILGVFALLGCLAIFITAKQVGLLASMVHLLCFSYVLKAFELKARSDFYQLSLLGLFVLASSLIFRQGLTFSLITLLLLVINLAVLLQCFSPRKTFASNINVIVMLLGQSMLLAVVLFLVFPRLSPFWKVPLAKSAETGLSDTVRPGDIANLTRSSKLAFRVNFNEQTVPNYSQLYWRAMVLEDYDGRQWTRKAVNKANNNRGLARVTAKRFSYNTTDIDVLPLTYRVMAEPSFQRYLFALAPANTFPLGSTNVIALADYTFQSSTILSQTKSYQLTSYLGAPIALEISQQSKAINLSYPRGSNPRLEQLAKELQHNYRNVEQRAQAVLTMINKQQYSYTLQPPLLKNNSLDQFFFDTQAGFCVHYASAFTFLMRASGIPARMVTGYLGGEFNAASSSEESGTKGHLSVYQYDAHAWAEIWVAGKGWLRVDPTGAVDPERVNSGWSSALLQQQSALSNDMFSLYRLKNNSVLNSLRLQFDALDYQWTRWVIGFSTKRQYDLLKSWFGDMRPWKLALIMTVALVTSMVMLMLLLQLLNREKLHKQPKKTWQLLYAKALAKLTKQGLEKPAEMTVNDFAKQVRAQCPELAIVFTQLSASYNSLSYQTHAAEAQAKLTLTMRQQYQQFSSLLKKQS